MKKLIFVIFIVSLISCENYQNQAVEIKNDFELVKTKSLIIHLDLCIWGKLPPINTAYKVLIYMG